MKNVLRSAKSVVHISPEWASIDAGRIGREIHTIRHAVPDDIKYELTVGSGLAEFDKNTFNIFYGGSIDPNIQSLKLLRAVIDAVTSSGKQIHVLLAGNENAFNYFKQELGEKVVRYLGWLSVDVMKQYGGI